jgi:hypothetical protein
MGWMSEGIHAYARTKNRATVVLTFFEHPHFLGDVSKSLPDLQSRLDG